MAWKRIPAGVAEVAVDTDKGRAVVRAVRARVERGYLEDIEVEVSIDGRRILDDDPGYLVHAAADAADAANDALLEAAGDWLEDKGHTGAHVWR